MTRVAGDRWKRKAYHLIASLSDETARWRDEMVVLIDPMQNPDGRYRWLTQIQQHRAVSPNVDSQSLLHAGYWPWGRTNHYHFDLNRDGSVDDTLTFGFSGFGERPLTGDMNLDFYFSSPLHFLPGLGGEHLDRLRTRYILLASGEGDYEDIGESWHLANVLGGKEIPNRVDSWGPQWPHEWATWREMLPKYLAELA